MLFPFTIKIELRLTWRMNRNDTCTRIRSWSKDCVDAAFTCLPLHRRLDVSLICMVASSLTSLWSAQGRKSLLAWPWNRFPVHIYIHSLASHRAMHSNNNNNNNNILISWLIDWNLVRATLKALEADIDSTKTNQCEAWSPAPAAERPDRVFMVS